MQIDERRIQEIVEKVIARLGQEAGRTPMEAVLKAAESPAAQRSFVPPHLRGPGKDEGRKEARIPRAHLGLFPDVDAAVKAARQAYEAYTAAPVALRERMVAAMRQVTLKHVRELAECAVSETGYGR